MKKQWLLATLVALTACRDRSTAEDAIKAFLEDSERACIDLGVPYVTPQNILEPGFPSVALSEEDARRSVLDELVVGGLLRSQDVAHGTACDALCEVRRARHGETRPQTPAAELVRVYRATSEGRRFLPDGWPFQRRLQICFGTIEFESIVESGPPKTTLGRTVSSVEYQYRVKPFDGAGWVEGDEVQRFNELASPTLEGRPVNATATLLLTRGGWVVTDSD